MPWGIASHGTTAAAQAADSGASPGTETGISPAGSSGSWLSPAVIAGGSDLVGGVFGVSSGGNSSGGLESGSGSGGGMFSVAALPGALSPYGPWGEGVYTPLDYPAMRFLNESETLEQFSVGSFQFSVNTIKALGVLALILFAAKKL